MRFDVATAVTWLTRLAWIGLAVVAPEPIGRTIVDDGRQTWTSWVVWAIVAAIWLVGVVALSFSSVVTLTVARTVVPLATATMLAVTIAAVDPWSVAASALSIVASLGVSSADFGRRYVQASAYGDEERFVLRPPPIYLGLCVIWWAVAASTTIASVATLDRRPIVSLVAASAAAATWIWGWRRWHRLSRRWVVVVSAGVVLHDHLVLAETSMIGRVNLATVTVADDGDRDAYDLTGGVGRTRVEVTTRSAITVLLAASPRKPTGTAIHLTAALIAPSRPGSFVRRMQRPSGPGS